MSSLIIFIVLLILWLWIMYETIKPHFEIVEIDYHKYKVLLWYNSFYAGSIHRKYKIILTFNKGKT